MSAIYKNWFVHNVFAHPASELAYWLARPLGKDAAYSASGWVHDLTIPDHKPGEGRG